jgi:hypothetical protein
VGKVSAKHSLHDAQLLARQFLKQAEYTTQIMGDESCLQTSDTFALMSQTGAWATLTRTTLKKIFRLTA